MKNTKNLGLPIYDNPKSDLFKISDVNNAHTIIDETYETMKNAKDHIVEIDKNIPIKNADAEIVDARIGKSTLGDKIREIDSSLENKIIKQEKLFFNIHDYKLEGEYYYDEAFKRIFEKVGVNQCVIDISGEILLEKALMLSGKEFVTIRGNNGSIRYSNETYKTKIKRVVGNGCVIEMWHSKNIAFKDFCIEGTFNHDGIYGGKEINEEGAYGNIFIHNVDIINCNTAINFKSMSLCKYDRVNVGNCRRGIILNEYCGDSTMINCYINSINCDDMSTNEFDGVGVYLGYGSNNFSIIGGKIEWNKTGIAIVDSQGIIINGIVFDVNRRNHIRVVNNVDVDKPFLAKSIIISNNRFLAGGTNAPNNDGASHIACINASCVNITSNTFRKGGDIAYDLNEGNNIGAKTGIHMVNCKNMMITSNDMIDCATIKDIDVWNENPTECNLVLNNNQRNINSPIGDNYYKYIEIPRLNIIGNWTNPIIFTGTGAYMWFSNGGLRIKTTGKPEHEHDGVGVVTQ